MAPRSKKTEEEAQPIAASKRNAKKTDVATKGEEVTDQQEVGEAATNSRPKRGVKAAEKIALAEVIVEKPTRKAKKEKEGETDITKEETGELPKVTRSARQRKVSPKLEPKEEKEKKAASKGRKRTAKERSEDEASANEAEESDCSVEAEKTKPVGKGKKGVGQKTDDAEESDGHQEEKEKKAKAKPAATKRNLRGAGKDKTEENDGNAEVEGDSPKLAADVHEEKGSNGRSKRGGKAKTDDTKLEEEVTPQKQEAHQEEKGSGNKGRPKRAAKAHEKSDADKMDLGGGISMEFAKDGDHTVIKFVQHGQDENTANAMIEFTPEQWTSLKCMMDTVDKRLGSTA